MDLIEKIVASVSMFAVAAFTWQSTKDKADKALMDERHETMVKAVDKFGEKQDAMDTKLVDIKLSLASMGGQSKSKGEE